MDFSFEMLSFNFKMLYFSFKMVGFSFKMVDFGFKVGIQQHTLARVGPGPFKGSIPKCRCVNPGAFMLPGPSGPWTLQGSIPKRCGGCRLQSGYPCKAKLSSIRWPVWALDPSKGPYPSAVV